MEVGQDSQQSVIKSGQDKQRSNILSLSVINFLIYKNKRFRDSNYILEVTSQQGSIDIHQKLVNHSVNSVHAAISLKLPATSELVSLKKPLKTFYSFYVNL